jgi:VanZ like family
MKSIQFAAWAAVAAITYATLTHVGFVYSIYFRLSPFLMRPEIRTYARFEHIVAFALFGALFAFAYPRRFVLVCCVVFFSAIILEYLQTFTPDRHGTVIDAVDKLIGGAIGISGARGILFFCLPRSVPR